MSDTTSSKPPPRASRRRKRGHKQQTEAAEQARREAEAAQVKRSRAVKATRQLDRQAFAQVDRMIGSFAQRRFGGMMPVVGKGFFAGARDEDEAKSPEIQQGFALYFVYGYRDTNGRRVIDMFREYGLKLDREQTRVLGALERTRFVVFVVQDKNEKNKQIAGRDLLRTLPMTALDHNAFGRVERGDVLVAYMFPVGDLWRPLGSAVHVRRQHSGTLIQGVEKLGRDQGFSGPELAERRQHQVFWLGFRVADGVVRAKV